MIARCNKTNSWSGIYLFKGSRGNIGNSSYYECCTCVRVCSNGGTKQTTFIYSSCMEWRTNAELFLLNPSETGPFQTSGSLISQTLPEVGPFQNSDCLTLYHYNFGPSNSAHFPSLELFISDPFSSDPFRPRITSLISVSLHNYLIYRQLIYRELAALEVFQKSDPFRSRTKREAPHPTPSSEMIASLFPFLTGVGGDTYCIVALRRARLRGVWRRCHSRSVVHLATLYLYVVLVDDSSLFSTTVVVQFRFLISCEPSSY